MYTSNIILLLRFIWKCYNVAVSCTERERPQFASWNQTNLRQANIELRYLFGTHRYNDVWKYIRVYVCMYMCASFLLSFHTHCVHAHIFICPWHANAWVDMQRPSDYMRPIPMSVPEQANRKYMFIFVYMCMCITSICLLAQSLFSKHANQK